MKPDDDRELMRWMDGEMSSTEARQFEAELERSPEEQRKVEAVKELGDVVRARYDAAADEAQDKLDGLWARIEGKLETPARARVKTTRAAETGGLMGWLGAWRGHIATGALSAAAAVAVMLAIQPEPKVVERERIVYVDREPANVVVPARAMLPIDIEEIDTAEGTPDVIKISGDEGEPPTVIITNVRGLRSI